MKRFITALLAAAVAGALFVASPLIAMPKGTEEFNKSQTTFDDTCDENAENKLSITAPEKLWPPNHKYFEDVFVTAQGADGEAITLTTTGYHDQYLEGEEEMNGAGNTDADIAVDDEDSKYVQSTDGDGDGSPQVLAVEPGEGTVVTDWAVRAERAGRELDGRLYTLEATAQFEGESCSMSVDMLVPHDMRKSNR